jgi:hypothetical protein
VAVTEPSQVFSVHGVVAPDPNDPTAIASQTAHDGGNSAQPAAPQLHPCYPNPFNSSVVLPVDLPTQLSVRLSVYNVAGQRLRVLVDEVLPTGHHRVRWDGRNADGREVGSGVYLVRLEAAGQAQLRRVALVR